ncbi:hypothetical protein BDN72DRAFT_863895 [Pluteus cervinus]|uniref:Uncharacterized protein n=1 Tax=Pluteus cervinus TaxID=181527 RepID=A0ACD3A6P6_9AGAR|nr:hypothetical protein BDN72DRAFT_863895 [Pluteus cervinus]
MQFNLPQTTHRLTGTRLGTNTTNSNRDPHVPNPPTTNERLEATVELFPITGRCGLGSARSQLTTESTSARLLGPSGIPFSLRNVKIQENWSVQTTRQTNLRKRIDGMPGVILLADSFVSGSSARKTQIVTSLNATDQISMGFDGKEAFNTKIATGIERNRSGVTTRSAPTAGKAGGRNDTSSGSVGHNTRECCKEGMKRRQPQQTSQGSRLILDQVQPITPPPTVPYPQSDNEDEVGGIPIGDDDSSSAEGPHPSSQSSGHPLPTITPFSDSELEDKVLEEAESARILQPSFARPLPSSLGRGTFAARLNMLVIQVRSSLTQVNSCFTPPDPET